MLLTDLDARAAVQQLHGLSHTKKVFILLNQKHTDLLVWVRTDGTRRTLSTREQVGHALSKLAYL